MEESEPDEPPSTPQHRPSVNVVAPSSASPAAFHPATANQHPPIPPLSTWKTTLTKWIHDARAITCCSRINILLVFAPLGILLGTLADVHPGLVFAGNALAIIPLAVIISASTERLATRLGDTWGALLNVTVGNTAELMIFFFALAKDQIHIVQASLLGSIATNLLFILGTAYVCSGLRYRVELRDRKAGRMSIAFLIGALLVAFVPITVYAHIQRARNNERAGDAVLGVSRGVSIALIVIYVVYLLLQMRLQSRTSHSEEQTVRKDGHTYVALSSLGAPRMVEHEESNSDLPLQYLRAQPAANAPPTDFSVSPVSKTDTFAARFPYAQSSPLEIPSSPRASSDSGSEPTFQATRSSISSSTDHDSRSSLDSPYPASPRQNNTMTDLALLPRPPTANPPTTTLRPSLPPALLTLLLSTALVALSTSHAISAIPPLLASSPHLSHTLIGFIILPLVGNAAETVTATRLAIANNLPLAKAVTVESSTQVVLMLAPVTVLAGWGRGVRMGLGFDGMELAGVGIGVGVVVAVLLFGFGRVGGWKVGVGLLGVYGGLALGAGLYRGR